VQINQSIMQFINTCPDGFNDTKVAPT